jgi:hypothetical protein
MLFEHPRTVLLSKRYHGARHAHVLRRPGGIQNLPDALLKLLSVKLQCVLPQRCRVKDRFMNFKEAHGLG